MTRIPTLVSLTAAALVAASCGDSTQSAQSADGGPTPDGGAADVARDDAASTLVWSKRASLPLAKQELAVVALSGKVYVLGGLDADGRSLPDVTAYDPKADTWSPVAPLPAPLHHVNAAASGARMWVVGSLRDGSFTADGLAWSFDPNTNTWAPAATLPAGRERGASMVAAIGTVVYVAGGLRGGVAVADFDALETTTGTWTSLADLPAPRDHGMGAAVGSIVYAVGGRSASIGGHTPRVDAYDVAKGAWTARAPMPTSRAGAAIAVLGGRILVAGGEGNGADATGVFQETEIYDPSSDVWTALPEMRTRRHGTGAATIDGVVLVPGGGTRQALFASEIVEALGPR